MAKWERVWFYIYKGIFQAFISDCFDDYGLQLLKVQNSKFLNISEETNEDILIKRVEESFR